MALVRPLRTRTPAGVVRLFTLSTATSLDSWHKRGYNPISDTYPPWDTCTYIINSCVHAAGRAWGASNRGDGDRDDGKNVYSQHQFLVFLVYNIIGYIFLHVRVNARVFLLSATHPPDNGIDSVNTTTYPHPRSFTRSTHTLTLVYNVIHAYEQQVKCIIFTLFFRLAEDQKSDGWRIIISKG